MPSNNLSKPPFAPPNSFQHPNTSLHTITTHYITNHNHFLHDHYLFHTHNLTFFLFLNSSFFYFPIKHTHPSPLNHTQPSIHIRLTIYTTIPAHEPSIYSTTIFSTPTHQPQPLPTSNDLPHKPTQPSHKPTHLTTTTQPHHNHPNLTTTTHLSQPSTLPKLVNRPAWFTHGSGWWWLGWVFSLCNSRWLLEKFEVYFFIIYKWLFIELIIHFCIFSFSSRPSLGHRQERFLFNLQGWLPCFFFFFG